MNVETNVSINEVCESKSSSQSDKFENLSQNSS